MIIKQLGLDLLQHPSSGEHVIFFGLSGILNMVLPHHFPELIGGWNTTGLGVFLLELSISLLERITRF